MMTKMIYRFFNAAFLMIFILLWVLRNKHQQLMIFIWSCFLLKVIKIHRADLVRIIIYFSRYLGVGR